MAPMVDSAHHADFGQATAKFVQWFTASDGTRLNPKIELTDLRGVREGRGVVCKDHVAEGEELFAIPKSLVLTATASTLPPAILQPLKEMGSWLPLIVAIIHEYLRQDASPWAPYFRVLPTEFDTLMFWNPAELAELQGSAVVHKIGRSSVEETWRTTILPVMLSHPDLFPTGAGTASESTAELIRLAHMAGSLIMAYAFDIDRDEDRSPHAGDRSSDDEFEDDDEDEPLKGMIPWADMLNADADRNNARLFQEDDEFVMTATKPIAAGGQIFNDYGPLPRSDLVRMYGYATDRYAQYDVVEFSHALLLEVAGKNANAGDPAWQKCERQLDELGLLDDGYTIPRPETNQATLGDAIPGQVHMLLRGLCTHAKGLNVSRKPKDDVTIEEAALLQAVLVKKLSEYGTTYAADVAIWNTLRDDPTRLVVPAGCATGRYGLALQVRMGEKEILHQLIGLCQKYIQEQSDANVNVNGLGTAPAKRKQHDTGSTERAAKTLRKSESNGV